MQAKLKRSGSKMHKAHKVQKKEPQQNNKNETTRTKQINTRQNKAKGKTHTHSNYADS
jgi:hypothetical protein